MAGADGFIGGAEVGASGAAAKSTANFKTLAGGDDVISTTDRDAIGALSRMGVPPAAGRVVTTAVYMARPVADSFGPIVGAIRGPRHGVLHWAR